MHGPISHVTVCGSPLSLRRAVRADGGEAFHEVCQLAAELWQGCGASLGEGSGVFPSLLGGISLSRIQLYYACILLYSVVLLKIHRIFAYSNVFDLTLRIVQYSVCILLVFMCI